MTGDCHVRFCVRLRGKILEPTRLCGNTNGAIAGANLYSLIESAKLYDLKVFDYLKFVFTELPNANTPRKMEQLLPRYAQKHLPKINKPKSE